MTEETCTDTVVVSDESTLTIVEEPASSVVFVNEECTDTTLIVEESTVHITDCVGVPGLQGPRGDPGPPGPSGAGVYLTYNQIVPASVWIINHNFGRRCQVTLLIGDEEVYADVVQNPSLNTVTVTWPYPVSGQAFLS
jgi:hypothetical protein